MKNDFTRTARLLSLLLLLIVPGALRGADRESGSLSLVGENDVTVRRLTFSALEGPSDVKREAVVHDLFASDSAGTVRDLFTRAHWELRPDGTFQASSSTQNIFLGTLAITGTYRRGPEDIEIHAAQKLSQFGPSISLDGLLAKTDGGYRLVAVVSASLPVFVLDRWYFEVRQDLRPGEPLPSEDQITRVDGIPPQPSLFEITVTGAVDGRKFHQIPGFLSFDKPGRSGSVSLSLGALAFGPGVMLWVDPSGETSPASYRLEARGGTVNVEVKKAPGEHPEILWLASLPTMETEFIPVSVDRGWLNLVVKGDEISGEVRLEADLGETESTYQAEIRGRRSNLSLLSRVDQIMPPDVLKFLGVGTESSGEIAGQWQLEDGRGQILGEVLLSRDEEEHLTGSLQIAGNKKRLAGKVNGGVAELREETNPEAQHWGLRLLPESDLLLGMRYDQMTRKATALVASRSRPTSKEKPFESLSPDESQSRLVRGMFWGIQGRCPEAIRSLEESLVGIQKYIETAKDPLPAVTQRTLLGSGSQAAIQMLGACDLQVGDYEGYLRHLRLGTEVLRPLRAAEGQVLLGEITRLRKGFGAAGEMLEKFVADVQTWCQDPTNFPEENDAGQQAPFASLGQEVEFLHETFSVQLGKLDALAAAAQDNRKSFVGVARDLEGLRAELRHPMRQSLAKLAADLHKALAHDPQLLRDYDNFFLALSEFGADSPSLEDVVQEAFNLFLHDLSTGIAPKEAIPAMWRLMAVYAIGMIDFSFQDSLELAWLARTESGSESPVEFAAELAAIPEDFRSQKVTDQGKVQALEKLQPFFRDLILFLLEEDQVRRALTVSEISRSRALADLLAGKDKIRQGLETVRARLGSEELPSPVAVSPPSLKKILDIVQQRGSTTIEYFLTDQQLLLWVISPDREVQLESRPVDRKALRASIDELRELLTGRAAADPQRTRELLRSLYSLLIAPVLDHLPSSPEAVLTLIPHQELFGVPFAALLDENGAPLIAQHPLVYGTSIATLGQMHKNREALPPGAVPRLLALVNPQPLTAGSRGQTLPPLDLVESQFSVIAGFFAEENRVVLKGSQATEKALMARTPGPSVLHLVTHGEFVEDDPLSSYIALAADGGLGDGLLRVPEVFRLDLPAELVVLWACETGRGGISADGVEGVSRGFLWAGAASLLLSLWEIPEQESLIQMYGFHDFWLRQGFSKARALQKAQIEQSRLYPDQPGLWAGFVLYGEAN